MRLPLAALLLAAPLAAAAATDAEPLLPPPPPPSADLPKEEPIPAGEIRTGSPTLAPPAPEAKAMSAAYIPRYHSRDSWYIGFGAGTGGATAYGRGGYATVRDVTGGEPNVGAARFEIGATLSDRLLLGLELTALAAQRRAGGETSRFAVTQADAVFTFFPEADGLFLRLGGGGTISNVMVAGESETYKGYNGLVGLGYAFWIGQRFNLSIRVDHSRARYARGDVRTSELWSATLGFDWF